MPWHEDFGRCSPPYPCDYRDSAGVVVYRVARWNRDGEKTYSVHRPGAKGWISGRGNAPRFIYRLPETLAAIKGGEDVHVVEGEKKVHMLLRLGFVATCNDGGAGKWGAGQAESLRGARRAIVWADNDEPGRQHAERVARELHRVGVSDIRLPVLEGLNQGQGIDDWIAAQGQASPDELRSELAQLAEATTTWLPSQAVEPRSAPPVPASSSVMPITLAELEEVFRRWLYLPDMEPLLALLGTVSANQTPGDPVWLLLVAPPGGGKTELLESLRMLPGIHAAASMTEGALLSGTSARERAKDAKGGLLRAIGERGIILCKDFGSLLNMHRDARNAVLAMLREVYDGSVTRHVGSDGGRKLEWAGHVGLVAGVPPTIDRHHGVMASLGERFVHLRMGDATEQHTARALEHAGHEGEMRRELAAAVAGLFAGLSPEPTNLVMTKDEERQLIGLATLSSRCRSAVEREGYSREIELIPGAESPTRLAKTLKRLFGGLLAIGTGRDVGWRVVRRVALDSIPAMRRRALEQVSRLGIPETQEVANAIGYPTPTTRRTLEDLAAYRLIERHSGGTGKADRWGIAPEASALVQAVPEMSEAREKADSNEDLRERTQPLTTPNTANDDFSGKVLGAKPIPSNPNELEPLNGLFSPEVSEAFGVGRAAS